MTQLFLTELEEKRYDQLDDVQNMIYDLTSSIAGKNFSCISRQLKKIRDYLNKAFPPKPKRNCDRFSSEDEAFQAWQKERGWGGDVDSRGGYGMAWAYTKWLFWTVKDTKKNIEIVRRRVEKTGTAWPGKGNDAAYLSDPEAKP